jgi:hypothetical protein
MKNNGERDSNVRRNDHLGKAAETAIPAGLSLQEEASHNVDQKRSDYQVPGYRALFEPQHGPGDEQKQRNNQ